MFWISVVSKPAGARERASCHGTPRFSRVFVVVVPVVVVFVRIPANRTLFSQDRIRPARGFGPRSQSLIRLGCALLLPLLLSVRLCSVLPAGRLLLLVSGKISAFSHNPDRKRRRSWIFSPGNSRVSGATSRRKARRAMPDLKPMRWPRAHLIG